MAEGHRKKTLLQFYLDKNPELKRKIAEALSRVTEEEKRRNLATIEKFVNGDLTWAEIKQVPQSLLKHLAKIAYHEFKSGNLNKAEELFKGLAVLDHKNWYYRAALGAVFQKRRLFEQAVEEYTTALKLNPAEVTSLVNRGQCYMELDDANAARGDFDAAAGLPLEPANPWLKRARALSEAAAARQKED
jgi:Flp pilus assembly protein TadD